MKKKVYLLYNSLMRISIRMNMYFSLLKTTTRDLERLREIDNVFLYLQGKTRVHKMKYFYDLLNNAEHIIWHGLYLQPNMCIFKFFTKFLKKSIWVGKGTDLFGWGRDIKTVKGITRIKIKFIIISAKE